MARSFNGASSRLSANIAPFSSFTMACWFRTSDLTNTAILMSWNQSVSSTHYYFLSARGASTGDPVSLGIVAGAGIEYANTSTNYTANTWQHACGVIVAENNRKVYLNGGNAGSSSIPISPSSITELQIGAVRSASGLSNWFQGEIATPAIWNTALTEGEITSLAMGFRPEQIRPQNLITCHLFDPRPLDLKGVTWSNHGSVDIYDEPALR